MTEKLTESLEDYLEAILEIEEKNKVARAKEIAEKINVKRASVTGALKLLKEKDLIEYEPYGFIVLKEKGKKIAKDIRRKHNILKNFFNNVLCLDNEMAENVACKMEHFTNQVFIDRLVNFINFIEKCPKAGENWIDSFMKYCKSDKQLTNKRCKQCMEEGIIKIVKK